MIDLLDDAGIERDRMHLDPLVFPVSTDPQNASRFFEAIRSVKDAFGEVKLTGGYSNVSFGMPNRKLLNKVFTYLCVQHGAESGIINPVAMPPREIARMDEQDESFQLARAVLTGEDMYGMEYISAHREGRLK
jgi:5-methyltetrahydrofolate--homocysteine methyltransferase